MELNKTNCFSDFCHYNRLSKCACHYGSPCNLSLSFMYLWLPHRDRCYVISAPCHLTLCPKHVCWSLYVVWFDFVLLPRPFPWTSLFRVLSVPLCRSSPALLLPAHATSPKPQTKTPCFPVVEEAFPLPPAACILPCQPREASSLRSLSIPSLGETNTCGLGYQYFNFYQYGVWLVVIHGFRSP